MVYSDPKVLLEDPRLKPAQSRVMYKFYEEKKAMGNLSTNTITGYLYALRDLAIYTKKPFEKVTKQDMIRFLNYKNWKVASPKIYLRAFYKWLYPSAKTHPEQYTEGKQFPDVVAWFKTGTNKRELPDGILTKNEIMKMVENAGGLVERTAIFVLYESGARASELLGIRVKDIEFDEYGARVTLSGKTGSRRIRLIDSTSSIRELLNVLPNKNDPEEKLFKFTNATLGRILKRACTNAGIKKKVFPHLIRHSRLTELAKTLKEPSLRVFAGWSATSKMPAIYVHLSGEDIDKQLLESRGIIISNQEVPNSEEKRLLVPKRCLKCGKENTFSNKLCFYCGAPMSVEALIHFDKQDQEAKEIGQRLLAERIRRLEQLIEGKK
ncbi:MAG: tyrosine-type recombinase/integrase [Candidatus Micrarchaeia archaeon]